MPADFVGVEGTKTLVRDRRLSCLPGDMGSQDCRQRAPVWPSDPSLAPLRYNIWSGPGDDRPIFHTLGPPTSGFAPRTILMSAVHWGGALFFHTAALFASVPPTSTACQSHNFSFHGLTLSITPFARQFWKKFSHLSTNQQPPADGWSVVTWA